MTAYDADKSAHRVWVPEFTTYVDDDGYAFDGGAWRITSSEGGCLDTAFGRRIDCERAIAALNKAGFVTWAQLETEEADRIIGSAMQW